LFAKIVEAAWRVEEQNWKRKGLYSAFMELVRQGRPLQNKVRHYAALLNTTPQNLNAVCRKAARQSAAEVLAHYIIDEAKRLLAYTDNTITEISFSLSFKDPSHFVKYFKRHTGSTPKGYRAIPN